MNRRTGGQNFPLPISATSVPYANKLICIGTDSNLYCFSLPGLPPEFRKLAFNLRQFRIRLTHQPRWCHFESQRWGNTCHFREGARSPNGVLAILILNRSVDDNTSGRVVIALVLTVLYAISDEFHQGFVPTRTASIADVTLDIFGALCGALISNIWANCRSATAVVLLGRFRE